jgi:hypothetical protein
MQYRFAVRRHSGKHRTAVDLLDHAARTADEGVFRRLIVSDAVTKVLGDTIGAATSLGVVAVRGYAEPVDIWRLDRSRPARCRRTSRPAAGDSQEIKVLARVSILPSFIHCQDFHYLLVSNHGVGHRRNMDFVLASCQICTKILRPVP